MTSLARVFVVAIALFLAPAKAMALVHVVQSGDTLAALAERYYGRIQFERILVAANRLDLAGGTPLVPGMHLLIPTVSYVTVGKKETWANLALKYLGSTQRSDVFALANDSNPWLIPEEGTKIRIPYNLAILLPNDETIVSIAQKYLGDPKHAWMLTHYNNLQKSQLARGTVLLIPLTELELTANGQAAQIDPERQLIEYQQNERRLQRKIAGEIPSLIADVRSGRYVDAIARGNRFFSSNLLTVPQQSLILRYLVEAYVALDATGSALAACTEWRKLDPSLRLDSAQYSPKILKVCGVNPP
jgi:phage tail protein X